MAIDKSLRQHYQKGKIVGPFQERYEQFAGKAAETTKKSDRYINKWTCG